MNECLLIMYHYHMDKKTLTTHTVILHQSTQIEAQMRLSETKIYPVRQILFYFFKKFIFKA